MDIFPRAKNVTAKRCKNYLRNKNYESFTQYCKNYKRGPLNLLRSKKVSRLTNNAIRKFENKKAQSDILYSEAIEKLGNVKNFIMAIQIILKDYETEPFLAEANINTFYGKIMPFQEEFDRQLSGLEEATKKAIESATLFESYSNNQRVVTIKQKVNQLLEEVKGTKKLLADQENELETIRQRANRQREEIQRIESSFETNLRPEVISNEQAYRNAMKSLRSGQKLSEEEVTSFVKGLSLPGVVNEESLPPSRPVKSSPSRASRVSEMVKKIENKSGLQKRAEARVKNTSFQPSRYFGGGRRTRKHRNH